MVHPDAMSDLASRVLAGDPRAVARAITLVEDDEAPGRDLIARIHPQTGRAYLVGITGAPGTGKSTLVDRLIAHIRRSGSTVGVLAVDPTSPFTGGAVLGDRARMGAHTGEPGVFIRSMATRGHLGGLARATADAALVLDAAGADIVLIETVGVGQDEVDVASTADASIVVLVPGTGDELQAIKAGVMEIGDIFVVNKADREGAERAVQAVSASLALRTYDPGEWIPPVLTTQAISDVGVDALWAEIGRFRQWASARHRARRRTRQAARLRDLLAASFLREVDSVIEPAEFERVVDAVESRGSDPYSAAAGLMRRVLREARPPGRESE